MRYLIISDIHANLEAFEAVLADAEGLYDKVWCLGDLVSVGPYPNECIDLLLTLEHSCVAGRDDWLVIGRSKLDEDYNRNFRKSILQTRGQLNQRTRDYLGILPERVITDDYTLVHGSPRHPLWEYIISLVAVKQNFDHFNTKYCFVGHIHAPTIFQETKNPNNPVDVFLPDRSVKFGVPIDLSRGRYIINSGGVGGGLKTINFNTSFYALWDEGSKQFELRKIPLAFNPFEAIRRSSN